MCSPPFQIQRNNKEKGTVPLPTSRTHGTRGDDPWHYEIREADEIARLFQELSALQLRRHVRSGLSFRGYPSSADSCFVTISYGDEPREISFFFSHWNADGQGGYIPSEGNFLGMDNRLFTVEDKGTISPSVSPE